MLVITRRPTQEVLLELPGGEIVIINIVSVTNRRAQVGIEAPAGVRIIRREILARFPMAAAAPVVALPEGVEPC